MSCSKNITPTQAAIEHAFEDAQGDLRNDAHIYGKIYRRSAIFMIRQKHPTFDLKGIRFDELLDMKSDDEYHVAPKWSS